MKVGDLVILNKREIGFIIRTGTIDGAEVYRVQFPLTTLWLTDVNLEVISESR